MKVNFFTEAAMVGIKTTGLVTAYKNLIDPLESRGVDVEVNAIDDYDVLHIHSFGPVSILKAAREDRPVVISTHTVPEEFRYLYRGGRLTVPLVERYLASVYSRADLLLSPSKFARDRVREMGVDTPVRVQSNGIDPDKYQYSEEKRERFRERHGIGSDETVIGSVGLLSKRKGLDTFVRMAEQFPDITFVWAGTNVYGSLLRDHSYVERLKRDHPDNLILPGYVDDIEEAYSAMDLFLFPTRIETEGLVALEAASVGIPVIASRVEGLDWMEEGTHCLKAGSEDEFVEEIERVVEGDDGVVDDLVEIYTALLDGSVSELVEEPAGRSVET
ncbi:MAG: glycosyltransferase family 4 protein [Candidatus Nanohaloarchaea archaeon]|nr:glycosyltransferase family 4 protein [Candidatus Nanohaloarchaea archaeon]